MPERFTGVKSILSMMAQDKMRQRQERREFDRLTNTPQYIMAQLQLKNLQDAQRRKTRVEEELLSYPDMSEDRAAKLMAYASGGPMAMYKEIERRRKAKELIKNEQADTVDEALGLVDTAAERAVKAATEETELRTKAEIEREYRPTPEETAEYKKAEAEALWPITHREIKTEGAERRKEIELQGRIKKKLLQMELDSRRDLRKEAGTAERTMYMNIQKEREDRWLDIEQSKLTVDGKPATAEQVREAEKVYKTTGLLPAGFRTEKEFKPDRIARMTADQAAKLAETAKTWIDNNWDKLPKGVKDGSEGWSNFGKKPDVALGQMVASKEIEPPAEIKDEVETLRAYGLNQIAKEKHIQPSSTENSLTEDSLSSLTVNDLNREEKEAYDAVISKGWPPSEALKWLANERANAVTP